MADKKIGEQDSNKDVESGKPVQLDEEQHDREQDEPHERPAQPPPRQPDR